MCWRVILVCKKLFHPYLWPLNLRHTCDSNGNNTILTQSVCILAQESNSRALQAGSIGVRRAGAGARWISSEGEVLSRLPILVRRGRRCSQGSVDWLRRREESCKGCMGTQYLTGKETDRW